MTQVHIVFLTQPSVGKNVFAVPLRPSTFRKKKADGRVGFAEAFHAAGRIQPDGWSRCELIPIGPASPRLHSGAGQ